MTKRKKPRPISTSLSKQPAPAPTPAPGEASAGINDVSSITARQMARAERAIDNLREEVQTMRKKPAPTIKVESPSPQVKVELPPRPRIAKVTIKYDQLGMPAELIPQYSEPAV